MKKGFAPFLIILIVAAVLAVGGGVFYFVKQKNQALQPVACTEEAKLCPDGSSVGRTGPNCEFATCPNTSSSTDETANWRTYRDDTFGFQLKYPQDFVLNSPYKFDTLTSPEQISWNLTTTPEGQPTDCYISVMAWHIFAADSEQGKSWAALYSDPATEIVIIGGKKMAKISETGMCGSVGFVYLDAIQNKVLGFNYQFGPKDIQKEVNSILGSFEFFAPTTDLKFTVKGVCEAKRGVQNNPTLAESYKQACAKAVSKNSCEQLDVYNQTNQTMGTPDGVADCQWTVRYDYISTSSASLTASWKTYRNEEYGFELKYPEDKDLITDKNQAEHIGFGPGTCDSDTAIICLAYDASKFPDANFNGAGLSINVIKNNNDGSVLKNEKECLSVGWDTGETKIINGARFRMLNNSNGAGGHVSSADEYVVFVKNQCFDIRIQVNTISNPDFYKKTMSDEMLQWISDAFNQILSTFKFIQ